MGRVRHNTLLLLLFSCLYSSLWSTDQIDDTCKKLGLYLDEVLSEVRFNDPSNHPEIFSVIDQVTSLDCKQSAKALTIQGVLHYTVGDILKAKESYFEAEKLLQKNTHTSEYALLQLNLGLVYVLELNRKNALICFERSLKISEQLGNKFETADAYLNMGLIKLEMKEYEESEVLLLKAISVLNTIKTIPTHGYANYNLSRLLLETKQYNKALEYNETARKIWQNIDDKKGLYFYSRQQSKIYRAMGDLDKEITYLEKALSYTGDAGIKIAATNFDLGKAYLANDNLKQAEIFLRKSVKEAQLADPDDLKFAAEELSTIYTERNDRKAMSDLLLDIVNSFKINIDIAKLSETKLLEKDISVDTLSKLNLSLTAATNELKRRSSVRFYLFSLAGILGLLTILYISKLNKDKEKLITKVKENNHQLKISNDELADFSNTIKVQNQMLESRNEDLENFAYTASHDIKSPLNTIIAYANLLPKLVDKGESKKVKIFAETINMSCKRLSNLVTDLLEYAKIDQKELNISKITLLDFFNEISDSLESELSSKEVSLKIDGSIPEQIFGDKIKLSQLFQNLISNSIKFSKEDSKPIIVIKGENSNERSHIIHVEDNGIGIPTEYLHKIFNMFEKLHTDELYAGTGIGLAVCQKVALLHNGRLEVDSEEGKGTKFSLFLPKSINDVKST